MERVRKIKSPLEQQIRDRIPTLDYSIDDNAVGVFDGMFSEQYCQSWIKHFDKVDAAGMAYSRVQGMDHPSHVMKDQSIDFANCSVYTNDELKIECAGFNDVFWSACYPLYVEKYSILQASASHKIYSVKLQKTPPGGGYHMWHYESMTRERANRLLVFILYLNDISDGGETEFLYLGKRVQPKAGRLLLWPAAFTHTHRGNPPLKDSKYVMTGWVEF
jgi:hypothetical protein